MSLRQPISLPLGFGPRPSMSFFLYNQDGRQAIARPYLDGVPARGRAGPRGPRRAAGHAQVPRPEQLGRGDERSVGQFRLRLRLLSLLRARRLARGARPRRRRPGVVRFGRRAGRGVLARPRGEGRHPGPVLRPGRIGSSAVEHEVFVRIGSSYYYTQQALFMAGSHPVVRVKPAVPLLYESRGWDFGWLMVRTDGRVVYRRCDPYTLEFLRTAPPGTRSAGSSTVERRRPCGGESRSPRAWRNLATRPSRPRSSRRVWEPGIDEPIGTDHRSMPMPRPTQQERPSGIGESVDMAYQRSIRRGRRYRPRGGWRPRCRPGR